jgi:hypothetical protein
MGKHDQQTAGSFSGVLQINKVEQEMLSLLCDLALILPYMQLKPEFALLQRRVNDLAFRIVELERRYQGSSSPVVEPSSRSYPGGSPEVGSPGGEVEPEQATP